MQCKKVTLNGLDFNVSIYENNHPIWLIVTHGIAEHLGRYEFLVKLFHQHFNVCFYDLRGHGLTEGKRVYVNSFSEFSSDLKALIQYLQKSYHMKRFILFGHSMGGLITINFMQTESNLGLFPEKIFLSSPAFVPGGTLGSLFGYFPKNMIQLFCRLPFSFYLKGLMSLDDLSHDKDVRVCYEKDPLNSMKISSKLCFELLYAGREVLDNPLNFKCPVYAAIGSEDRIANVSAFKKYFSKEAKQNNILIIPGGYHELHNEIKEYQTPYFEFLKTCLLNKER